MCKCFRQIIGWGRIPNISIPFISCPLPYQAVQQIRAEVLVHAEALDSDPGHPVVLEVGIHQAYQLVGCGSSGGNQLVEGRTCRPGD
jgi:hypothetical protein